MPLLRVQRRFWRVPFIVEGRFPLVHVDSLALAIVLSLGHTGAFIVSDQMTDLRTMASTLRAHTDAYVPAVAPLWPVKTGVAVLELLARLTATTPIMARVQIDFVTQGLEPKTDKATATLGWQPLTIEEGLRRYLAARKHLPRQ